MVSDVPGSWRGPFQVIGLLGIFWVFGWLAVIRPRDLDRVESASAGAPEVSTTSREAFVRRYLVLIVVVMMINLTWHFYRVWLPTMLREHYLYTREQVNYFTSAFYIFTDIGCLAAGFATRFLIARGRSVHGARLLTFGVCSLLTALGIVVALLPASPALLMALLVIAAGALGLFPVYYSFSQELSSQHQGKVTGTLGCFAWLSTAVAHPLTGMWVDKTHSYSAILMISGVLPMIAVVALVLFWDRPERAKIESPALAAGSSS